MTEEQRRALFALREALRLCEGADVHLYTWNHGGSAEVCLNLGESDWMDDEFATGDVDRLLSEHPE